MKKSFKNNVVLCVLVIFPVIANAQLNHFIYLQTDGKQPFYAKLDKKIFSSSSSGYLIIPKLKDGSYTITIGFPKNGNREQSYVCNIDGKDAGYLVKDFGEKGWGLFNFQTLEVVMADNQAKEKTTATVEKTDEFSKMLSDVVNDPTIKQEEKPTTDPKKEIAKNEIVKQEQPGNKQAENIADSNQKQAAKTGIVKKQMIVSENGTEITYIDMEGEKQDTINLIIPVERSDSTENAQIEKPGELAKIGEKTKSDTVTSQTDNDKPLKDSISATPQELKTNTDLQTLQKKDPVNDDKKFLPVDITHPGKESPVAASPSTASLMINSDCKSIATDDDFIKLRKKMAGAGNNDDMISAAQKFFKAKCYTTDQIKNLSVLFLTDAGKYKFFDLAYQYANDSQNFGMLEGQLTEAYYISRFKAMIHH